MYGVLSYAVSSRRREFGVRLALGAQPATVLRLVLREGLTLALAGCALGLAGAYVAARSLTRFLFGVAPWDPATLAGVFALVLLTAAAACLVPGWRASVEDPAGALRAE
jgi:ABC-type antimicrobial peptide transport system permease subunit